MASNTSELKLRYCVHTPDQTTIYAVGKRGKVYRIFIDAEDFEHMVSDRALLTKKKEKKDE